MKKGGLLKLVFSEMLRLATSLPLVSKRPGSTPAPPGPLHTLGLLISTRFTVKLAVSDRPAVAVQGKGGAVMVALTLSSRLLLAT
jgi:hypothetical protein